LLCSVTQGVALGWANGWAFGPEYDDVRPNRPTVRLGFTQIFLFRYQGTFRTPALLT
jgi:hypothetical protein